MTYRLDGFADVGLDEALLKLALDEHRAGVRPRQDRLWTYYRNPLSPLVQGRPPAGRWYALPQESALPPRFGTRGGGMLPDDRTPRRDIVIENDIAWRIHTMVDFMFGKTVGVASLAKDPETRDAAARAVERVIERSGGMALLQDMALLGHVFGHVDLALRVSDDLRGMSFTGSPLERALAAAEHLRVEIIDPRRGVPILDDDDYRTLRAYVITHDVELARLDGAPTDQGALESRLVEVMRLDAPRGRRRREKRLRIISPTLEQAYRDGALVDERELWWTQGALPIAHIQNMSQPFRYEGQGDVEPLIPLQDELNTRLSDRAFRVTMQAFKMYLAKGLEGAEHVAIGPGQMWITDNTEASLQAFGGDEACPGEEAHILEVREALDKVSGVPPLAAGVVRAKIGNLSSANALRVTLMGLILRTQRKRVTYGAGLSRLGRLILTALDSAGALATREDERAIRIDWPDPLPLDDEAQARAAAAKASLGVPRERVLAELGYAQDPGIEADL